jgi:hypothetical protein
MATATQIVTGSSEAISNRIPVVIPRPLLRDLIAMYEAAGGSRSGSFPHFVSEIIVKDIARFRLMRIKPEASVLANLAEDGQAAEQRDHYRHKAALTAEDVQVILHLRFVLHIAVDAIAERFGVGGSTIGRVIETYKSNRHNPSAIAPSASRTHGDQGEL